MKEQRVRGSIDGWGFFGIIASDKFTLRVDDPFKEMHHLGCTVAQLQRPNGVCWDLIRSGDKLVSARIVDGAVTVTLRLSGLAPLTVSLS